MSERDRCGPDLHYDVVTRVDAYNATPRVREVTGATVKRLNDRQSSTSVSVVVVANVTSLSVDVNVSSLSSMLADKSVPMSVVAVNSDGSATEPLRYVTVTGDPAGTHVSCQRQHARPSATRVKTLP